jgi:outer membrane protein
MNRTILFQYLDIFDRWSQCRMNIPKQCLTVGVWLFVFLTPTGSPRSVAAVTNIIELGVARGMALKSHPRITTAELRAIGIRQSVAMARSSYFPLVSLNGTAVGNGGANTRIAAGGLNNPQIYERAAAGASVSQLISDFGRTSHLLEAVKLESRAGDTNVLATRAQLLLEVDGAYILTLRAGALIKVARERLAARQVVFDLISSLATNRLKSELDVVLARVGVEEARLLQEQADTEFQIARTSLAALIGASDSMNFEVSPVSDAGDLPSDSLRLVTSALARRPELVQARLELEATRQRAKAEKALDFPTVSAFGAGGSILIHDEHLDGRYAAAGVNINIPLFNGGYNLARQKQASALAGSAEARVRDLEETLMRDVRVAWMSARQQRAQISLSEQLVSSAREGLALARVRYEQGLSSFVELNQSELNVTSAELNQANTRYEYLLQRDRLDYLVGDLK